MPKLEGFFLVDVDADDDIKRDPNLRLLCVTTVIDIAEIDPRTLTRVVMGLEKIDGECIGIGFNVMFFDPTA